VTGYLIRRVLQAAFTVLLVTIAAFGLIHLAPGGELRIMLGKNAANPLALAALKAKLGLNQPIPLQYLDWLWRLLHGDFGYDYYNSQSVGTQLAAGIGVSGYIVLLATIISVLVAVPLGVIQAIRRNTWIDHTITTFSFVAYGIPIFFLGLVVQQIFQQDLGLVPLEAQLTSFTQALTNPLAIMLPVFTLVVSGVAGYSRYMRSAMLDQITQEYVRTAIAKGAHRNRVIYGHVLRNALIPMVTLIGFSLPALAGGALIVEYVFNIDGIGLMTIKASFNSDFVFILGSTLIVAVLAVLGSLLADISYAALDPRVRLDS
jgi:peptide/nickel transport system permease protein